MLLRILPVLAIAAAAMADTVHTSDGQRLSGKLVSLDAASAVIETSSGARTLRLGAVTQITLDEKPAEDVMVRKGQHVLCAGDGSLLAVRDVSIANGRLRATSGLVGDLTAPLDGLVRLLRPNATETPEQVDRELRDAGAPAAREDAILVRSPAGKPVAMNGLLSSLGKGQIAFTYEGADTAMADDTVCAVVFAPAARPTTRPAAAGHLVGADGSRIAFQGISITRKGCSIRTASLGTIELSPRGIATIQFHRQDVVYLSDLVPSESAHTPFFDDECPWQKDRTASGRPLSLDGKRYEKGLSIHARTRLAFDLDGRYARLSGVAGIDDDLRHGRALLSILGDDKPLVDRIALDRTQPPAKLDLPIAGIRRLTLIVDFAPRSFGSGAQVTLCDLTLTPPSAKP